MQDNQPKRSHCGMRCDICPAFEPNRTGTDLQKASSIWAEIFDVKIEPEAIICDGCRGNGEKLLDKECPVRPCVISKGFDDCSECEEMPCENLKRRWVSRQEIEAKINRSIPQSDFDKYVLPFENVPYLTSLKGRDKNR